MGGFAAIPSGPVMAGANFTPPAPKTGDADIIEKISGFGQSPEEMIKLAQAAATPIPGGHSEAMPATLQYQPKIDQPGQLNHEPVVGAGNARAQGIGNAAIGVMNLIGKLKVNSDNKKRLQLATDTSTLLTAQASVDQAKQILSSLPQGDPRRKMYEDSITGNMQKMNAILANDKTRKAIGEGFNIDFTNPKELTEENQAVLQGKEMAHKEMTYADQFNTKTPQTMQANIPAQAAYQQAALGQKMQSEMMRSLMTYLTGERRNQTTITATRMREIAANTREQARLSTYTDMAIKKLNTMKDIQDEKGMQQLEDIHQRGIEARKTLEDKLNNESLTKDSYDKQMLAFSSGIERIQGTIKGYLSNIQTAPDPNAPAVKEQKTYLELAKLELRNMMIQRDGFVSMFKGKFGAGSSDTSPKDAMSEADEQDKIDSSSADENQDDKDFDNFMNNYDSWANLKPE